MLSGLAQLGAATGGVLEGTYRLPQAAVWDMQFFLGLNRGESPGVADISDELVTIIINGAQVGMYKAPSCSIKVFAATPAHANTRHSKII